MKKVRIGCLALVLFVTGSFGAAGRAAAQVPEQLFQGAIKQAKNGNYSEARKLLTAAKNGYDKDKKKAHWADFVQCCDQLTAAWAFRDNVTRALKPTKPNATNDELVAEVTRAVNKAEEAETLATAVKAALDKGEVEEKKDLPKGVGELADRAKAGKDALPLAEAVKAALDKGGAEEKKDLVKGVAELAERAKSGGKGDGPLADAVKAALDTGGADEKKDLVKGVRELGDRARAGKDAVPLARAVKDALDKGGAEERKNLIKGVGELAELAKGGGKGDGPLADAVKAALQQGGADEKKDLVKGVGELADRARAGKDAVPLAKAVKDALEKGGAEERKDLMKGVAELADRAKNGKADGPLADAVKAALEKGGADEKKDLAKGVDELADRARAGKDAVPLAKAVRDALEKGGADERKDLMKGVAELANRAKNGKADGPLVDAVKAALEKGGADEKKDLVKGVDELADRARAGKDAVLLAQAVKDALEKGGAEEKKNLIKGVGELADRAKGGKGDEALIDAVKAALEKGGADEKKDLVKGLGELVERAKAAADAVTLRNAIKAALEKLEIDGKDLVNGVSHLATFAQEGKGAVKALYKAGVTDFSSVREAIEKLARERDDFKRLAQSATPDTIARARDLLSQREYQHALAMLDRLAAKAPLGGPALALRSQLNLRVAQRRGTLRADDALVIRARADADAAMAAGSTAPGNYAAGLVAEALGEYSQARDHFREAVKTHAPGDEDRERYQAALRRVLLNIQLRGAQGRLPGNGARGAADGVPQERLAASLVATLIAFHFHPAHGQCGWEVMPCPPVPFGCWGPPACWPVPPVLPARPAPQPGPRDGKQPDSTPPGTKQPPLTAEQRQQAEEALRLGEQLLASGDPEGYFLRARAYALKGEWRKGLEAYAQAMKHALLPEYLQYARDLQYLADQSGPRPAGTEAPKLLARRTPRVPPVWTPPAPKPAPAAVDGPRLPGVETAHIQAPAVNSPFAKQPSPPAGPAGAMAKAPPAPPAPRKPASPAVAMARVAAVPTATAKVGPPPGPRVAKDAKPLPPPVLRNPPNPAQAERAFVLARQHYNAGDFLAAESDFREAVQWNSEDARYWYFMGLSQLQQGKAKQASASFEEGRRREQENRPAAAAVNLSLERIQGPDRQVLNEHRGR